MLENFSGVSLGSVKWDFSNGIPKLTVSRLLVNNIYTCCSNHIGHFEIKCTCSVPNATNHKLMQTVPYMIQFNLFFSWHSMLKSSHWTVGLVQWLQYQQALVDPQNPLVAAVSIQNPKHYRETLMMMPSLTDQVIICRICGPDMVDTHHLHQLDREQGTVVWLLIEQHRLLWFNICFPSWHGVSVQITLTDNFYFNFNYHFSHSTSTADQKTSSSNDLIRGTEVTPPPSSGFKQTANSASWLSNITSSTFRSKQPKDLQASSGERKLVAKFK